MCLLSVIVVLAILAALQPAVGQTIFEDTEESIISVDERGDAHVRDVARYLPSLLADTLKPAVASDPEGAKEALISGTRCGFARYGFEIKNPHCEISGLGEGENFTYIIEYDIGDFAIFNSEDNVWTITFRQWTVEEAQEFLDKIKSTQSQIGTLASDAQSRTTTVTTIILPEGAQITNSDELENRTIEDNCGGGSYIRTTTHVGTVNGQAAVIKESEALFKASPEITIAPEELSPVTQGWQIEYTGVLPPPESSNLLFYVGVGAVVLIVVLIIILLIKRRGGADEGLIETAEGW